MPDKNDYEDLVPLVDDGARTAIDLLFSQKGNDELEMIIDNRQFLYIRDAEDTILRITSDHIQH